MTANTRTNGTKKKIARKATSMTTMMIVWPKAAHGRISEFFQGLALLVFCQLLV